MKAASHDIHGLMNYMACGIKEFHFPLMVLLVMLYTNQIGSY